MIKKFYLKLLMSLLLVALAVPQGKATDLIVADGAVTDARIPIYGFYYDTAFKNTMVYPSSMLSEMKGATITAISFYTNNENYTALQGGAVTISLGEIGQTTLTGHLSGLTPVFTGVPVKDGAKCVITFDTPYEYKGGNLAVESYLSSTGSNSPTINFYGIEQSSASFFSYHANLSVGNKTADFLPKVAFTFEGGTPAPVISGTVTPTTLDFGTVTVGENGTATTITVANTGNTAFTPVFSTLEAPFSIEEATEIAAGESKEFTVTYHPTAAGDDNGSFTVTIGEQEPITVNMTGTATAPAVDYAVTMSDNTGAHNYGNVLVNSSNVWTLTITNNGTQAVTPTLSGIEAPFSTTYTAAPLAAGKSVNIAITFAPTEVNEYSNTITISFPEAGDAIAAYTCELTGNAVEESPEPSGDDNEVVKLITVDKRSIYEPNFIDTANGNTTPQQLNCYDMRFKMAQPDDPAKQIKAGDLHPGNNLYEFYAIDDFGTEFRFATINLFAEGQPSSNPSVSAMDAPIKVTPSVEYYTEDGMPVHSTHKHNTTLNYTEKTYNDINDLVDLEGVIDYVNDTWSANTATNAHPDHYKFQIRGVGQYGDLITSLTAEYVESHMTGYGNSLVDPEGWDRGAVVQPNTETDGIKTYYFYDVYIKRSFFDERGITGPVTVVVNTTLSGSGFNADNYKSIEVNGVEQIVAKEAFKDYTWTVPLVNEIITDRPVAQVPMGVVIRLTSKAADFNRARYINIYGGGTGVSNIDTVNIYKSSMNVKAYTQKQVDEDTDRNLVAMNAGAKSDVNVLAYGDPAVTGYKLYENGSASTANMTEVASANHEADGDYSVNSPGSPSSYTAHYDFVRDESLGNIDGMWLPMCPADASMYYLPVTYANGVGDDGIVRSENNTYGSAMQQVQKNGSVAFDEDNSQCIKSTYTWVKDGVRYAIYNPNVKLESELPAATGYQLYNYRMWVDYEDNAPAWDFEVDAEGKIHLTTKMDRPLYEGTATHIGGAGAQGGRDLWSFVAPSNLEQIKLVARFYYKKNSAGKARPTDSDRLYYVVENQITLKVDDEGIITGIDNVSSKAVANVKYYNLAGIESDVPFQGVNIEVTTYEDGSRTSRKILK